jgi:hypothetical protein
MDESSIPPSLAPLFAPLPIPVADHLVLRLQRKQHLTAQAARELLLKEVREKRPTVYFSMRPFVNNTLGQIPEVHLRFSSGWLLRTLSLHSPGKKPLLPQTLSHWHGRGLLRYREYGLPDYDSAAALLIARLIDQGERNFLPSKIGAEEPLWWCWRQDSPQAPVQPCPVPLPPGLLPSTLLWTPWAGASWDRAWTAIGRELGAIRWARPEKSLWTLSPEEIALWDPELTSLVEKLPQEETFRQDLLQTLATLVLLRLAADRFQDPFIF